MARVLLIEDADNIRKLFTVNLQARGFDVIACNNARDGLREMHENRPDIALLDLKLPGMDGADMLDVVKNTPDISDIPIIIVTASVTDVKTRLASHPNVVDIIIKPVEIDDLVQRVHHVLEKNE